MPKCAAQRKLTLSYDDMLGTAPAAGQLELETAELIPFPGHPFKLYTGERLEKMMESIRQHGVLEPVLVWLKHEPDQDTVLHIILSGHNRVNASKLVGLNRVPVRILTGISEAQAQLIVTETNLHQRSFADLSHSERALVIYTHYEAVKQENKNAKLLEAIEQMCGIPSGNGRSIEKTCAEFGASQGTIARYLRIYQLLPELRNLMDQEKIPLRAGVELSWLSIGTQKMILAILIEKGKRISEHQAVSLRKQADTLDEAAIRKILCGEDRAKPYSFTVSSSIIAQYFQPNARKKEISAIMEKALKMYFESISEDKAEG